MTSLSQVLFQLLPCLQVLCRQNANENTNSLAGRARYRFVQLQRNARAHNRHLQCSRDYAITVTIGECSLLHIEEDPCLHNILTVRRTHIRLLEDSAKHLPRVGLRV